MYLCIINQLYECYEDKSKDECVDKNHHIKHPLIPIAHKQITISVIVLIRRFRILSRISSLLRDGLLTICVVVALSGLISVIISGKRDLYCGEDSISPSAIF